MSLHWKLKKKEKCKEEENMNKMLLRNNMRALIMVHFEKLNFIALEFLNLMEKKEFMKAFGRKV